MSELRLAGNFINLSGILSSYGHNLRMKFKYHFSGSVALTLR